MHSSISVFWILQTSFYNIFILVKRFCIRKLFFVYSSYPLWVQNKKKLKRKWKMKKKVVTPQEICVVHVLIIIFYIISPSPHHHLYCFFFREWCQLAWPSSLNYFVYILINLSCFSQTCHSLMLYLPTVWGIILYFANLQSHQCEFLCINIFFHKANRTQFTLFSYFRSQL